ncbi:MULTISPECIES: lysylphosphatidylglycerol synthase transmembrane domain-containing protein [unclassified Bradyrhizobium]|uniref:lysylphosphatidylglycerol synthase transmembrane domain-containing protein n=1 Tax=unclassified Bradyrhizobium TaxID=2631580 RepID=UPI00211E2E63|nr:MULTISPECIES: lysylphosphatidylglycerol synthase transmembrane domain-containing protein [unclassified Bradyrhizobium]MDD1534536.1 TIGR00374 family protein [Bradyrhizobium sp. WBOS8]MDD1581400.1 TIGR00374 family protein [Bradyrhizobium sp. WBOS4]UUO49690.1 TIGR00374 family protein [Bradyrhizobium sp. WBOS04]UUO58455.1 TIGR00374 family protein [Bradyrhizobium sp. WBOS08]
MPPGKKTIIVLTKFLVSAGIIVLVARDLDLSSLKADLLAVELHMLALAMLLLFAQTFALCNRWILILRAIGVSLDWVAGWRIVLASAWFNQVLPSGGEAIRIWMLRRHGIKWSQTLSSIVADRFIGLLTLGFLILAGMPFLISRIHDNVLLFAIAAIVAAAYSGAIVLMMLTRMPARVTAVLPARVMQFAALLEAPLLARAGREALFGSAVVVHLLTIAASYALAIGLDAGLSALDAFVLVPLVIMAAAVPLSIGGWGIREGAMVGALGLVGIASDKALAISILLGLGNLIVGFIGGAVWLLAPERAAYGAEPNDTAPPLHQR